MFASVLVDTRKRSRAVIGTALLGWAMFLGGTAQPARAAECPGNPNALGTSRTLVVDPTEHPRIGTMQYRETLPLADHEVVLTFDDGPLPKYSNQVLAILASQCIKATFFTIGSQARANPEGVRKLAAAGHTIGTHTQTHPLTMNKMPIERARQEIDDGIASTLAALNGDRSKLAPFFRIPGLMRAEGVENYLASRGIQTWSADFPADDWRHISPQRVYDLAIQRIEAHHKGILLLHDIQPRTVAALPRILNELKARGYRIVHVVPATPDRPATPTEPQQWFMHPPSETIAVSRWPRIPNFVYTARKTLPAPVFSALDWRDAEALDHAQRARIGQPHQALWPQPHVAQGNPVSTLAVPAASVFRIPEGESLTLLATRSHANHGVAQAATATARQAKGARRTAHLPPGASRGKARPAPQHAEQSDRSAGAVRLASLKKRAPRAEATAIPKRVPD
ncbi:polysaccharide deacetylase family protein [Bradyrhizobium jicamae]|uniref:Chitooligosaccharide deacetylase n=1 Tax=Bradyrhizobium jicamae TaxID=280332 RepID=A0ABS5FXE4_9BRAD|nr:polysaccharide deacetylase family protein [Bradyrhizobium jicamae]MBR0801501.1 polysaccharide deacetylase family protein [Bradyrhizobium jicamae]